MTKRKYQLKENIFDTINRDSAYWIGYLYADGNCTCENKVRLCLSTKDKDVLYKFRNFIGSEDKPIKDFLSQGKYPSSRFEIRSWKIRSKLKIYELTKRKEVRGNIHPALIQNDISSDFIRGIFDGDGSFYYDGKHKNSLFAEITGRKAMLKSLKQILVYNNIISDKKNIVKNGSIFRIRMAKQDTIKLIKFMYNNEPKYYLNRKYGIAKNYLDRLNETTSIDEATVEQYYRPTNRYNAGKVSEYNERKFYKQNDNK